VGRRASVAACAVFASMIATQIAAQRAPLATTRSAAVASALSRSPLVGIATSDKATADAAVGLARQWENPTLGASVSKSGPQQHYSLDVPFDPWWQRSPRIGAATAAQQAAALRYRFAMRSIAFDTDTAYTRAQLARARSTLSARTARDADSLLVLARVRRDAGDASELDVELANVFAGQAGNIASNDSVATRIAALTLQTLMGLASDSVDVVVADSLALETPAFSTASSSLLLDAATQDVRAASLRVDAERRRRFGAPTLSVGVEAIDPGGQRGALATAGISLPLPLFNRNQSAVALTSAELQRSQAQLSFVRLTTTAAVLAAQRDAESARARAIRSAQLVASADRIATLSLLAYREGASTLLVVLEAQRTARDILGQYFDDVALARNAASLVDLLLSPSSDIRP
jgi:cobalt-zinc-cadmium efflux system outer membrane protein